MGGKRTMKNVRRILLSIAVAFGLGFAAPAAVRAGDEKAATSTREVWVFEKKTSDTSDHVEVDVTKMSAAERAALEARYTAKGYSKEVVSLAVRCDSPSATANPPADLGAMVLGMPQRIERLKARLKALEDRIAKDDAIPDPAANAARRVIEEIEPKATVAIGRTLGLMVAQYMSDQKDPEKAAAYQAIFKALGPVIAQADSRDLHASGHAALNALLDLVPTMRDPKGAQVVRDLVATMRKGLLDTPPAAQVPEFGAGKPILGRLFTEEHGIGSILREALREAAGRGLGGATLEPLGSGLEGFHVTAVRPGSAAAQLGVLAGDTIIEVGGGAATPAALLRANGAVRRAAGELSLTVIRQGKQIPLKSNAVPPGADQTLPGSGPR